MIRNLKMLGLALVAVFAMSSLAASVASATDDVLTLGQAGPLTLTGEQHNGKSKFTLSGQSVECTNAKIVAHIEASEGTTLEKVTTTPPAYSECTYAGLPATVNMNGCDYLLTGNTVEGDMKAHVKCPAGAKIELTLNSLGCKVFVAEQEAGEGYTATTIGTGTTQELTLHITAKVNVTSLGDPTEGVTCASLTKGTGTLCGTYLITGETPPPNSVHVAVTDSTKL